ncbi:MAG: putative sulfate exporter family transporter, partial [Acidobacteriota bacterium]|nr:putative sulfate exporter family transporter [Acidobacteriota bacterium]
AICGGSAIAAIAPITEPDEEELALSLGTVFTLNSVALFLFPAIGIALHLTQRQFGLWAALAIHDTSSVVGAAAKYGPQALAIGTIVKLTRALWIVPVAIVTALTAGRKAKVRIPWFILFFCLAALSTSYFPHLSGLTQAGRVGLSLTLFLIGTGINRKTIRSAGGRVMAQGLLLWIAVASASLAAIVAGWIRLG